MSSATKLRQKQNEHYAEAQKFNELATADDADPELIPDLLEKADTAMKLGEELDPQIVRAEKLEKLINGGKLPKGNEVNLDDKPEDKPKVTIPASCKRVSVGSFLPTTIDGMDKEHRAYAFGRYLLATAAKTCSNKFSHLSHLVRQHEDAFGTMNAATEGGNAGIWVPEQFGEDLVSLMLSYGKARQLLQVVPMFSDKRTDPKEGSDPTPTFVGEGVEATDVTPTDDSTVTLTARKLMAILINSSELQEDAIMAFGESMMRRMANGFAKKEDECALGAGDGTSTYGGMKSIKQRLLDVYGVGGGVGLILSADNVFADLVLTDFEKCVGAMPDFTQSSEDAAVWVMHKYVFWTVCVRLELAAGGTTAEETRRGMRVPVFLGHPVIFSNVYPKTDNNSQVVATFGDHARAARFGDRRAYSVSFSDQATVGSVNLWSSDQVGIKATERFDVAVHSVGDATDAGPVVGLLSAAS